ncbi:MAG: carboxypeptidase regulatory-like domain-containing protein [Acidobacteria bacterium]|nr:carboxypeptidase regulatory-like domain-containing protein [Acidobacteriota bacterium]MBS1866831.1 carboxypeptidase regulatory-like domain-containing protein [Acidobacteriota bacterium]
MSPFTKALPRITCGFMLLGYICICSAVSQEQQTTSTSESGALQSAVPQIPGSISGQVIDQTGTFVSAAIVKLTHPGQSAPQEDQTNDDGLYSFANVPPGPFEIMFVEDGFAPKTISGILKSGEALSLPQTQLSLATETMEVHVSVSEVEIAETEIKEQEKQRIFGLIPNFYVSYEKDPAPMNTRQKMSLAWKSNTDPLTIAGVAFVSGIEQANNSFSGYGQGAQGYGKRFGSTYADVAISTFLGSAILPAVFKQDPRYLYQGTGSTRSRIVHAIASSVMARGDNKRWEPNYSNIIGSFATGGISNLYYPASDRNGAMLTIETALIRIGESAGANLFQEFVIRKLTPGLSRKSSSNQQQQP